MQSGGWSIYLLSLLCESLLGFAGLVSYNNNREETVVPIVIDSDILSHYEHIVIILVIEYANPSFEHFDDFT